MKLTNKIKNSGSLLVLTGVLILCIAYATGLTSHNWIMVLALIIESLGCILCYSAMKK